MPKKGKKKKQAAAAAAAAAAASTSQEASSEQQALQKEEIQESEEEEQTSQQALPGSQKQKGPKGPQQQQMQHKVAKSPQPLQGEQQVAQGLQKQQSPPQQQQQQQIPQNQPQLQGAWASRKKAPQQVPQPQQTVQPQVRSQLQPQATQGLQQQQVLKGQLPQQQQILQDQQQPQGAWVSRSPQVPQQQQAVRGPGQQPQQAQQQTAWGPRPQVPGQSQQQVAQGFQQPPQVPQQQQTVRSPGQQPQQAQQQTAWGSRPQVPGQLQQQVAQGFQQPPQVPQQQQTAWGPRTQVPGQLQQQVAQPPQVPQTAWASRQQGPQSQQKQQKALIDISGAGDHRQVQAGGSGMHQQQPSTSTRSLDVSELGSTDPFGSEITEKAKMSSAQLVSYYNMIPKRKNPQIAGTQGLPITVWTNMFRIIFDNKFVTNAVHYDITVKPHKENSKEGNKKDKKELNLPKPLCRNIFEQLRNKHFKNRYPAYDGKKNAYSANDLPINDMADVFEYENKEGRRNRFQIIIKKVANIDLSWIKNLVPGPQDYRDQTAVQVLDIIMRHAPESQFTNIGRSLYWEINENEPLGGGLALARGGFMSGVLGWSPYLNVDVSHKGFTMKQRVLAYIAEVLGVRERDIAYNNVVHNPKIQSFLRGLKVTYEIPNVSRRTHRIIKLSDKTCYTEFVQDLSDGSDGKLTSIKKYFLESKRYNIQRPDLPTLHVSTKSNGGEILLPIELCTIMAGQPIRKLDEEQTSNMIKKAATDAFTRKQRIEDAFKRIEVNNSPVMSKEFRLSVRKEMEMVKARVLHPPELKYGRGKAQVRRGTWNIQPFNEAKHLEDQQWTIVNLSGIMNIDPAIQDFAQMLQSTAKDVGMTIGRPVSPSKYDVRDPHFLNKITNYFSDCKRNKLKLIIVIIPNRTDVMYGTVKKITEMDIGVLTQCMKLQTLKRLQNATVRNILLKINSKLNGINHTFDRMPACLNDKYPCMLVGADVTHPSPDSKDSPSIAAVAASRDKSAFRYNVALRLQQPKEEMILDLENIILSQLMIYHQETKFYPKRIVYYRDGVSEGQLPQVMHYEIGAIKKAVTKFNRGNIEINCLVVQKRHHVRLFPKSAEESDDRRNYNVRAGTIVDTTITHPEHIDFYLVSHASIQGTARPTKYRCIYNQSNFTEDDLEQLTYHLCHIYARCARAVSYPAPTYYAHLAAYRGRALIQGRQDFRLSDLEREQRNFIIKMGESPMFFV